MDFGLALKALVMGVVQGLTEFLPISSSAHLILTDRWFTYWSPSTPKLGKPFDIAVHLGTLVALLIYFRKDIAPLLKAAIGLAVERRLGDPEASPRNYQYRRLVCLLAFASMPALVFGFLLHDYIENLENYGSMAFGLIVFGLILWGADRYGRHKKTLAELPAVQVFAIGLGQSLALMPGVSRSGSTMTVGLLMGLTRAEAANFSFLLALPVTGAAIAYEFLKGIKLALAGQMVFGGLMPVTIGIVASFVSGYFCMAFLMRFLRTQTFTPFVIYRLGLGVLLLALWFGDK